MSERATESSVTSDPTSPAPMHENARECTVSADSPPQLNTPTRALTQKHRTALDMLVAGKSDYEVCFTLKIHASTLYRWKHHNPIFIAELNRRHQELWTDLAADLRLTVAKAIRTIDLQLHCANDLARHRAARSTPAQRQALLDQILAEEAQAEADLKAAAAQRSALYQQRRAQSKTSMSQPSTPETP